MEKKIGAPRKTEADFWARFVRIQSCLVWVGFSRKGYGLVTAAFTGRRRAWRAHVLAWTLKNGPVPPGSQLNHKCDNTLCGEADHMYAGTHQDNMVDLRMARVLASGSLR